MLHLKVGIINGSSGQRNQDTIARFWKNPPDCHVIVSTEAGSEGVNLQVANVLVNYAQSHSFISLLAFWAVGADTSTHSYLNIFKTFH